MPYLIGFLALIALFGIAFFAFWFFLKKQKKKENTLYSIVGILSEPVFLDSNSLAKAAEKAWGIDLTSKGETEGVDGFVVGESPIQTIKWGEDFYLVHSFPKPYVEDPETTASGFADKRLRELFASHQAWFAVDFLAGKNKPLEKSAETGLYRHLARLFAELLDDRCQLILLPQFSCVYAINAETEKALLSDDPLKELQESLTVPIIEVADDNPEMRQAQEKARQEWPRFVEAFETKNGETFSIKAPVTHGDVTEFIWIEVTAIEGDRIYGKLANEPFQLGPLKIGSKVVIEAASLNDWFFQDARGQIQGAFTLKAIKNAAKKRPEDT